VRTADLDRLVEAEVLAGFGYKNLNRDVAEFVELVPTTENVALAIADRLRKHWRDYFPCSSARLSRISMQETERNSFEVVIAQSPGMPTPAALEVVNESVIVNA